MKARFNTYDIVCGVTELQKLIGLRVNQIYDIDHKTYLFRFQGGESKTMLLIESGIRFHTTVFEWPKNVAPSGFSMKLRKHLKNKRLESLNQLGADRIIDFQFGVGQASYHVIVELYDRGNIILTDHELTILYILRPHFEGEEVRFVVREKYPSNRAKELSPLPTEDRIRQLIEHAVPGENLKRFLMPLLDCGPSVIEHVLIKHNLNICVIKDKKEEYQTNLEVKKSRKQKKKDNPINSQPFNMENDLDTLMVAIKEADEILKKARYQQMKGYVIQTQEERPSPDGASVQYFYQNIEYHPYLFDQCKLKPHVMFESFMLAVDEFYSTMEGQKIDIKTIQKERDALKKLSNVKKDHVKRLEDLSKAQEHDKQKADLLTRNQGLVDKAILVIRSAIANQMSWPDIQELVKAAQFNNDLVAISIKQLKLELNQISLSLSDPYRIASTSKESNNDNSIDDDGEFIPTMVVDVDLGLSAWANARKYYDQKRSAAQKEQKTIDASQKALKSAQRKTQQTLKEVRTISTIAKARKVYWFEKFYWFISSENYLVIGGRDAQQNELIVKRYMRSSDIYVHAEIQGASSVIIRNPTGCEIPPKTLLEAGTMAISYSVAWDAKVVTNAYWVRSDQVSKTAPTGEYLGTGSFMVRGKKNFLPPCYLIMGLSLLFKLEDSFIQKHQGERKIRTFQDDLDVRVTELGIDNEKLESVEEEVELRLEESGEDFNLKKPFKQTGHDGSLASKEQTSDQNEEEILFPDTQVKIEHDTGRLTVQHTSNIYINEDLTSGDDRKAKPLGMIQSSTDGEYATLIPAAPSRRKQQLNYKRRKEEKDRKKENEVKQHQLQRQCINAGNHNSSHMKRGQKGKLKKIKSKYKDQDDEERKLRMEILNSAGKGKLVAADFKDEEEVAMEKKSRSKPQADLKQHVDVDDSEDLPAGADVEMIDSLTGVPFEDDELLFAIPVVAPYQALQNYKFKVKLTPGTGKRGRAAKMALTIFSKDKVCSTREKDLLKSIKEETLARNIPGKVKLSAPQLQKFKK